MKSCADYVRDLFETFAQGQNTALRIKMRAASMHTFSWGFNYLFVDDFFQVDGLSPMHCMDYVSRYSRAVVMNSLTLRDAIIVSEPSWMSRFSVPEGIQADDSF